VQKQMNQSRCGLGCGLGWVQGSMYRWGVHGTTWRYDWTVCVRQQCGLTSNCFNHLLLLFLT